LIDPLEDTLTDPEWERVPNLPLTETPVPKLLDAPREYSRSAVTPVVVEYVPPTHTGWIPMSPL